MVCIYDQSIIGKERNAPCTPCVWTIFFVRESHLGADVSSSLRGAHLACVRACVLHTSKPIGILVYRCRYGRSRQWKPACCTCVGRVLPEKHSFWCVSGVLPGKHSFWWEHVLHLKLKLGARVMCMQYLSTACWRLISISKINSSNVHCALGAW